MAVDEAVASPPAPSRPPTARTTRRSVATDPWRLCDTPSGGTFYFPLTWVGQNVATDQGGVNLLLGMAELWSNHVENLLGVTQAAQSGKIHAGRLRRDQRLPDRRLRLLGQRTEAVPGRRPADVPELVSADVPGVHRRLGPGRIHPAAAAGVPSRLQERQSGHLPAVQRRRGRWHHLADRHADHPADWHTQPANTQTQPAGGGTGTIPLGGLSKSGG